MISRNITRQTRIQPNGKEAEAPTEARKAGMLDDNGMAWLAAELACAVNQINCEQQMIATDRQDPRFQHLENWKTQTMRYGQGGLTEIRFFGDIEIELPAGASAADYAAALEAKKKA